jgi:hypothetical protein
MLQPLGSKQNRRHSCGGLNHRNIAIAIRMQIIHTIKISRSPDEVFPWIGNPEKALKWQINVAGSRILNQVEGMVGTTFEETISDRKGSTTLKGVITKWETNKLVAFQLEGQYNRVETEFQLEPDNGYTKVIQRAKIEFISFTRFIMFFMGSFFKKKIEKEYSSQFERLKNLCEETQE